jgi:hypothetical protein
MFGVPADVAEDERSTPCAETERPDRRRALSDQAVRLLENWVVAVVTLLSAGVILATLWAQREHARASGPAAVVASEDAATPR